MSKARLIQPKSSRHRTSYATRSDNGAHNRHPGFEPAPEIKAALDFINAVGNDLDSLNRKNVAEARAIRERLAEFSLWHIPVETVRNFIVVDDEDPQHRVPVRLYVPDDKQLQRDGRLPLVLFFHGGGWTLGSVGLYDSVSRQLARQIPALVLSVDYRLAPENPFPAAVTDAVAVLRWARNHAGDIGADPTRLVISGDSAGGNLATVAASFDRKREQSSLALQVLFYPSANASSTDYESYRQFGTKHLLTLKAVETFREFYLPDEADWKRPEASPLLSEDLSGMPRTLIITAGCDPLRDEGLAYAQKLLSCSVPVTYHLEPGMIHGFLNFYNLHPECSPYAEATLGYAAGFIRQLVQPELSSGN